MSFKSKITLIFAGAVLALKGHVAWDYIDAPLLNTQDRLKNYLQSDVKPEKVTPIMGCLHIPYPNTSPEETDVQWGRDREYDFPHYIVMERHDYGLVGDRYVFVIDDLKGNVQEHIVTPVKNFDGTVWPEFPNQLLSNDREEFEGHFLRDSVRIESQNQGVSKILKAESLSEAFGFYCDNDGHFQRMGRYGKGRAFQSAYLLNRDASAFFMTFNAYKGDSGVHRDIVPSMLQTYKNMVEYRVESYELSKSSGTTDDQMKEVGEIIPTSSDYKFLEMSKGEQYHWMHDYMSQFQDAITYDSIDRHREVTGVTISSHSHQFLRP